MVETLASALEMAKVYGLLHSCFIQHAMLQVES